jgi:hypothetical protein
MGTAMKFFGALLTVISFIFVLGSVGACEWDNITLGQCFIQSAFGILGVWVGLLIANAGEQRG